MPTRPFYSTGNSRFPRARLAWFSRAGKEMETVADADSYYSHDISPDNRRVVWELMTQPNGLGALWVKDLERGTRLRLTNHSDGEMQPHFWPDGSKIAFTRYRGQPLSYHLAIKPANGSGSEELVLESHTSISLDDVSPDGAYLLFSQYGPPLTLWVLPLAGNRRPILYRRGEGPN